MEDWLRKCLDCYHCYTSKNDDSEVCCKRADKGKDCRFYSEKEYNNRVKKEKVVTEYINKELLIRTLKNKKDCVACTDIDCVECICDFIACMVPSDVVEVVRCKNCKKWNNTSHVCGEFVANQKLQGGGKVVFITAPDDFCSYGIRKE